MLDLVDLGKRSFSAYRGIAPDEQLDEVLRLSKRLRGLRCLQLNATPYGGGVSELLRSGVALLNDLGIVTDWRIIRGDQAFFQVTKRLHNGLQGGKGGFSESDKATYLAQSRLNASQLSGDYDVIIVHDPQPAALPMLGGDRGARWVWRCHIDTAHPNPEAWEFLRPFLGAYDAAIFTLPEFIPPAFPISQIAIHSPAIDPLSPKNLTLPEDLARRVLEWIGVRLDQPLVTQISRFDPWKDPLGVIAAYRLVGKHMPELQLAMVGSLALDDPEGWDVYRQIQEATASDNLIHIFTNLVGVGNIEVNAFQSLSDVVIQKSIREGFGLVVSEALWKGTPVVAGRAGGIPLQMPEGTGGILVDSVEECAQAVLRLLKNPQQAHELGARGREHVRQHFLMPRMMLDYLRLLDSMVHDKPLEPRAPAVLQEHSASAGAPG